MAARRGGIGKLCINDQGRGRAPFDLRLLHPHSTTGIDVDGPPNHLSIPG